MIIYGKDTVRFTDIKRTQIIVDSLNIIRTERYRVERQRIIDSLNTAEIEEEERYRDAPTLYYKDNNRGKGYYESVRDPDSLTLTKNKGLDSLISYTDLNIKTLHRINESRNTKIYIDTSAQEEYVESILIGLLKRSNNALLVKEKYKDCNCSCVDDIINELYSHKRLKRILLSEKTNYISISIIMSMYNTQIHISYGDESPNRYKNILLR